MSHLEEPIYDKIDGANVEYSAEMLSLANQLNSSNQSELPLSTICNKLRNNQEFQQDCKRKREAKKERKE